MKSLSPNTKIDFRKLLAIVHGLYRTVRTDSVAALSKHAYNGDEVLFRTDRCWLKFDSARAYSI